MRNRHIKTNGRFSKHGAAIIEALNRKRNGASERELCALDRRAEKLLIPEKSARWGTEEDEK